MIRRLSDFLEHEYLPACRTSTGYDALPNGKAWYLARVASQTTTDLAPDDMTAVLDRSRSTTAAARGGLANMIGSALAGGTGVVASRLNMPFSRYVARNAGATWKASMASVRATAMPT